ncbi:TetR/AcrR family transcriptional regulator [Hyphococcus luteus]|uniref:TetR family transcriptional regulator n=1 Tax=Hyphococcus luteus TaxID=2058213 RepID=A0A2S7K3D6_9PROT|nr:TetR family transcriptional regulator [Marinicaulis flavus]PQA87009.1 TetR family transcriptional regulator [Marinicaulis flavus]
MSEALAKPADARRERILRAAERSFIASGFHGARMAQIAKEAKMSPGHIYHYFESKEQIIAEMIRAHFDEKLETLERYRHAGDKLVDMMIENLSDSFATDTDPFWSTLMLEIAAEATRNDEIAASIRNMNADMRAKVLSYLRENVDVDDLEARLEVFVALIQGLGIRNIINPDIDKEAVVRIARDIVELLFRRPSKRNA